MSDLSTTSKSPPSNISQEEELVLNDTFVQPEPFTNSSKEHPKQWTSSTYNSAQRTSGRSSSSTYHSRSEKNRSSVSKSSTTPQSCANTKIVAIVEGRGIARGEIGMACIDIKNPVLLLSQFADTQAYLRLAVQLNVLKPLEVVMPNTSLEYGSKTKLICRIKELFPDMTTVTVQRKYFNETKGLQYIQELCATEYKTVEIEVSLKYYCLAACAALLKYFEFKQNATYATNSLKIVYCTIADTTMISMATARNLELVTNELGKVEHCLYGVLNHTLTPGGDRLLRANILQPPCDLNTINTRLDCISELIEKEELFYNLKSVIGKFVDTENLLSLCVQIPKEENVRSCEQKIANVICMKHTLELVKPLHNCLSSCSNGLFQTYFRILSDERFLKLQEKISLVIHTDARWQKGVLNMHMQKCFAVKPNINGLLDVARRAYSESVNDVSDIVKQLEKQYNLPLQVGYSSVRGFFIQIPCKLLSPQKELPSVFLKVNKYKNFITCTTEDLIKLNDRIRESLNEIYLMSDFFFVKK
ncbi:MutS protein like protein [Argiope bruennichi]|uniref:MutS protein like protein n=1 Tax=Argiope bruennichi TaxID=94029 RepID=A0A8T0EII9_ARGBR|nr:MutS protein like protein [Argiope bruennichi]